MLLEAVSLQHIGNDKITVQQGAEQASRWLISETQTNKTL